MGKIVHIQVNKSTFVKSEYEDYEFCEDLFILVSAV